MIVCYFGTYNPKYPRNRVLIDGLRKNGVNVVECNSRRPGVWKYVSLIFQFILKARNVDAIIVGFPMGRGVISLLKSFDRLRMTSECPVIIDGFVSQYDAEVFDRRHFAEDSREAKKLFSWEQNAFRFASKVLVDTDANAEYYSKIFSIPREHFAVIPVGTDEDLFRPLIRGETIFSSPNSLVEPRFGQWRSQKSFNPSQSDSMGGLTIHFSGTYNPLQGIDVIVRAISLIQDKSIRFRLVGNGEMYNVIIRLAKELNVFDRIEFIDRVPYDEYARLTQGADICLGIFNDSPKTERVIPNKVVEAMACGKAMITADTLAIRELLVDGVNASLCKPNDPVDLSKKILELCQNKILRVTLGKNSRATFLETLSTQKIGKQFVDLLQGLCL